MKKLKHRLIFFYSAIFIIFVSFLMIFLVNNLNKFATSFVKNQLSNDIEYIHQILQYSQNSNVANKNSLNISAGVEENIKSLAKKNSIRITVIDFSGVVLFDSIVDKTTMENHLYRPEIIEARNNSSGVSIRSSQTVNVSSIYVAKFYGKYYIRVSKTLDDVKNLVNSILNSILIFALILLVFGIIINFIFVTNLTKPINQMIVFVKKIFNGDLNARILNYRDDEFGYLQNSMNKLAENIQMRINDLTAQREILSYIIESLEDPIALMGKEGEILFFNKSFLELWDYPGEVENKIYFNVIRNNSINTAIKDAIDKKENIYFEEKIFDRVFQVHISYLNFTRIEEVKNIDFAILLFMNDITKQVKINQMKTDLVGNLSHELKTPISIIKGYLETIRESYDDRDSTLKYIQSAIKNTDKLNSIIDDMLKLNKLETITYSIDEAIDIKSIIGRILDLLSLKIKDKNIKINLNIDNIPDKVNGNNFLVEEIFFNLIDNAINYNVESGEVSIEADINDDNLIINISDTGIGIPPEECERIFERFYRIDKARRSSTGGTGLGLSIVKHAVSILGWKIKATPLTKGTCFSISIPVLR